MQNKKYSCPGCSFEIQSPAGVEDVLKHAKMHSEAHHKDKPMTEVQYKDMIKGIRGRPSLEMFAPDGEKLPDFFITLQKKGLLLDKHLIPSATFIIEM